MRAVRAVAALLFVAALASPASAQVSTPTPSRAPDPAAGPGITAAAAILVDGGSNEVLFARHVRAIREPASLTKMATALVATDEYALDEVVKASPLVMNPGGSRIGLEPGFELTVEQLLYGMMLKSGNDAAVALAAHHPNGYKHFIALMNAKARSLGAHDTNFRNPNGLPDRAHVSTAWDMALIARELLADPFLAHVVATDEYTIRFPDGAVRTFDNHNKLIGSYPGAIGVKTGFTNRAGNCLAAAAQTGSGRFVTVVLGSPDHYRETRALFAYGSARASGRINALPQPRAETVTPMLDAPPAAPQLAENAPGALVADTDRRWAIAAALLAAAMLATLIRVRPRHPLRDAAALHAYLEPLVPDERARVSSAR